ncbi:Canalicular multispecific organic anion transporter 2 [Blyttiomyces sp. JEL0837]|nr:Canalicular multispecific organic anion transporter 2 [Blyttiomyces sp. JEL0837]
MSGTIRENILFGRPYNLAFYESILDACALRKDLELWPAGDLTEIGERGITLSGGQVQRISIARALFSNADIYLFDDPLSAVDMHRILLFDKVDSHIYKHVIGKHGLLRNKTRIFVTHGLHHLPSVDNIVVVKSGRIIEQGTYKQLLSEKGEFSSLAAVMLADKSKMKESGDIDDHNDDLEIDDVTDGMKSNGVTPSDVTKSKTKHEIKSNHVTNDIVKLATTGTAANVNNNAGGGSLTTDEEMGKGQVGWEAYHQYMEAFSYPGVIICVFLISFSNVVSAGSSYWLNIWSSDTVENQVRLLMFYFGVYVGITVLFAVTSAAVTYLFRAFYGLKAATVLHDELLESVMQAPMSFFNVTPTGRIINRFSKDIETVCDTLPLSFFDALSEGIQVLAGVIVCSIATPLYILMVLPLVYPYIWLQRWFDVRIDTVGLLAMVISAALCVASKGHIDAGMAGMALTYAASTAGFLSFFVQDFCVLEVNVVSVERINQYIHCPREAPRHTTPPPRNWPEQGKIEFNNYSTRYREGLDYALDDLNIQIRPGERIGIVGRTGSGKSTMVLAITRILEAQKGDIQVDGLNISHIGLRDLRQNLTVVSQEPLLFATTVRENLDPFSQFSDNEIWRSLERVQMKDWAVELPERLDTLISEGGSNLSVGERQLLCMAKAILRHSKILVLDEATSSIDIKTDELIQRILREEFAGSTVLCIAHRINTILDYDRILVLGSGKVVEFDTPTALLGNPNSAFAGLCRQYQDNIAAMGSSSSSSMSLI